MIQISHPGWRPSPLWAMRWVAVYVGIILMTYVAGFVLYGTPRGSMFGPAWQGATAACQSALDGADGMYLLTADGVPHVDPETGLLVGLRTNWGGNDWDRAYAASWNDQMRSRVAATPVPRRFDGLDTDGASIRRRFETRAADVVDVDVSAEPGGTYAAPWVLVVGGLRIAIVHLRSCEGPGWIRVGDRSVRFPGRWHVSRIESADGTPRCAGYDRAWIPGCDSYRALFSDDGRQLWLLGPASTDDGRPATWTVTIDVATAATVGVDYVEGP